MSWEGVGDWEEVVRQQQRVGKRGWGGGELGLAGPTAHFSLDL